MGKSIIILRADMSPSVHIDNEGKYILILGGRTQGLDDTKLTAETIYLFDSPQPNKR